MVNNLIAVQCNCSAANFVFIIILFLQAPEPFLSQWVNLSVLVVCLWFLSCTLIVATTATIFTFYVAGRQLHTSRSTPVWLRHCMSSCLAGDLSLPFIPLPLLLLLLNHHFSDCYSTSTLLVGSAPVLLGCNSPWWQIFGCHLSHLNDFRDFLLKPRYWRCRIEFTLVKAGRQCSRAYLAGDYM